MRAFIPSLLVLLCCWGPVSGDSSEEQYRNTAASPRPRRAVITHLKPYAMWSQNNVILNPFNIFGNPKCTYNGDEGRCYGEVECLALAGNYGAFCPGLQGLCCLFYRTCNQRTSQEASYFRNLQWPLEDQAPNSCTFRVVRRSDKYCGLKVEAEKVDLPSKSGNCANTYVHITGVAQQQPMPLCGRATGINFAIDFRHVTEVNVHVNSSTRSSAAWNLKLTQVLCSDFEGATGGGDTSSGTSTGVAPSPVGPSTGGVSATARPPVVIPMPPAPPSFGKCGMKGSSSRGRRDADTDFEDESLESFESREGYAKSWSGNGSDKRKGVVSGVQNRQTAAINPANRQPFPVERDNPFLRDLVYDGPDVSDSNFNYWKGPDSLLTSRVTFGKETEKHEYPWQVAMFVGGRYHCGASVIGDEFILTAAHCVVSYKVDPSVLRLSLGDHDVSNSQDGDYIEARVATVRVHEDYSRSTLQNDVAVLKLTKKINYSDRVRPVCLPTEDIPTDNKYATITGWGRDEKKQLKTKLQELTSRVTTNAECGKGWQAKKAPAGFIVDTMLCMDSSNGDSCNGDSGGPAVMEVPEGSGIYQQVGIVSFGSGSCTDVNLPGVYTRVSKFRDWIRQQMQ